MFLDILKSLQFYLIFLTCAEPSPPHISEVSFPDPNSLLINWLTSLKPNGNVTKYRVYIYWDPDNENMIKQRNYCKEGKYYYYTYMFIEKIQIPSIFNF